MPRKRPFSAKQKRLQLRDRRQRKRGDASPGPERDPRGRSDSAQRGGTAQPRHHERFRLQLGGPRAEALALSRRRAQEEVVQLLPHTALELDPDSIYGDGLDFPRRPPWSCAMSGEELRQREESAFRAFLHRLPADTAPFEHNLETWRQLWRVLEMSDVLLLIADARHPALNIPPALTRHVSQELRKGLILILNKADLSDPPVLSAWGHLLRQRVPSARVVPFSAAPARGPRRRRGCAWSRAVGPRQLLEACESIVGGEVDLSSWRARLERAETAPEEEEEEEEQEEEEEEGGGEEEEEYGAGGGPPQWERYRHGVLTLGCVGLPNAGKSSVLNALLGRSAVSVSRTPGRTRYFQTHFLTPTVRLCDCPGLVFPSRAPPELQVLGGVFPISQLPEPYSAVGFLAARIPLPALLGLPPPASSAPWTAWDICEAWAEKRGYRTAHAARHDVYRAANGILRMAAHGTLRLCMRPPGYGARCEQWEDHPDTAALRALLQNGADAAAPPPPGADDDDDESEEELDESPPPDCRSTNPFAALEEDEC